MGLVYRADVTINTLTTYEACKSALCYNMCKDRSEENDESQEKKET